MSFYTFLVSSGFVALASAHGVILGAVGIQGSPTSIGFAVDPAIARNCTGINPCQQDATIIRDAEILANVVNSCGRTELNGNIDVGESTEMALAAGNITQVQSGTQLTVTIHQVNADGAGPYVCDLDPTSNANFGFENLQVTNNVPGTNGFSLAKTQAFDVTVTMPENFTCTGGSTGDICTVRCRNNAVAGPFGGCFAVQQIDTQAKTNTPANIATAQTLKGISAQVDVNRADLPDAIAANQNAGSDEALKNLEVVNSILINKPVSVAFAAETPDVVLGPTATAVPNAGSGDVQTTEITPQPTGATGNNGNNNGNNNNNQGGNNNGNGNGRGNGRGNNNNNQGNNQGNNQKRSSAMRWAKRA